MKLGICTILLFFHAVLLEASQQQQNTVHKKISLGTVLPCKSPVEERINRKAEAFDAACCCFASICCKACSYGGVICRNDEWCRICAELSDIAWQDACGCYRKIVRNRYTLDSDQKQ